MEDTSNRGKEVGMDEFRKIYGLDREEELTDYLGKEIRKSLDNLEEE